MDNYKIKVKDEAESKEAQELFVQLGYKLFETNRIGIVATEDDGTIYPDVIGNWDVYKGQELTLPQLRDLVVLKRNDVKDATHTDGDRKAFRDSDGKYHYWCFDKNEWFDAKHIAYLVQYLMPINQDPALISGAEAYDLIGKRIEVEAYCEQIDGSFKWQDAKHLPACDILNDGFDFRLKPQTIKVELDMPKPFKPRDGDDCFIVDSEQEDGFYRFTYSEDSGFHQNFIQFGVYKTENDVKKAVEQLRKIRGTNS